MSPSKRRATASPSIAPKACRCAAAAFTNFSRDHLDYHADDGRLFRGQDAAVRAKCSSRTRTAVVWTDDPQVATR